MLNGRCSIGLFRILGIELELACNRGSCGTIFSHVNIFNDVLLFANPLFNLVNPDCLDFGVN